MKVLFLILDEENQKYISLLIQSLMIEKKQDLFMCWEYSEKKINDLKEKNKKIVVSRERHVENMIQIFMDNLSEILK